MRRWTRMSMSLRSKRCPPNGNPRVSHIVNDFGFCEEVFIAPSKAAAYCVECTEQKGMTLHQVRPNYVSTSRDGQCRIDK